MATQQDLDTAIAGLTAAVDDLKTKLATELTEMNNAFNRLLQKIASGTPPAPDFQTEIASISASLQKLQDISGSVVSATAQAQVEGN